jgi:uncharacterized Zn-binding protein involved in type VI secretion
MSKIAVKTSSCSGHGKFPYCPPTEAVDFVTVNGIGVFVQGNAYTSHSDGKTSYEGTALSTRPWITINGMPVVCEGDPVSCGSTVPSDDQLLLLSMKVYAPSSRKPQKVRGT